MIRRVPLGPRCVENYISPKQWPLASHFRSSRTHANTVTFHKMLVPLLNTYWYVRTGNCFTCAPSVWTPPRERERDYNGLDSIYRMILQFSQIDLTYVQVSTYICMHQRDRFIILSYFVHSALCIIITKFVFSIKKKEITTINCSYSIYIL